ncbi:MAG: hypothetical protein JSW14_03725 [Candidatus Bathyarchaeum sp.]|nr:MAG: hypothetical protein JSW14_03725 [Candidatus Bathyarchaeum sp.]
MAKTRATGISSPQITSTGSLIPQDNPMIKEAEFAGTNSGLETVSNNLELLDMAEPPPKKRPRSHSTI